MGAVLLAFNFPVEAQQHAKVPKIGWLGFRSASDRSPGREAFKEEFRVLGHLEGKNIVIERRSAEGKLDRLSGLADELVRLNVHVLLATSTAAALAAKNATRTIPIIFIPPATPLRLGWLIAWRGLEEISLGSPPLGRSYPANDWNYSRETIPKLSRVAVLSNPQPADLPVEQPKKFELIINLKAAKQIGLTIPPNVLMRADRVIK